jgi:hypothetical protein
MTAQQKIIEFINFLERRLLSTSQEHNRIKLITRIEELKNELSQLQN